MNILVLAAGPTTFDTHDGGFPLCLTEIDGVPLIERLTAQFEGARDTRFIFALRKEEIDRFHLDNVVTLLTPGGHIVKVSAGTQGSACTALLAIDQIDNDEELLILSANELVHADIKAAVQDFRARELDAGTICFPSIHPRYSYVRVDSEGLVTEAAQRRPLSRHATVGIFWFKRGHDFVSAAMNMIRKGAHSDGEFYVCPSFNEMVLEHRRIGIHTISAKQYQPLKSERQVQHVDAATEHGAL